MNYILLMKKIIEKYKDIVIQIGTPYSVGTGFFLKKENLIITSEHVIRDNKEVTINGRNFKKHTTKVLFVDPLHDIAFLEPTPAIQKQLLLANLTEKENIKHGEVVVAVGHPYGHEYTATQGIISNTHHIENNINFIQHDAALNPGNSGGPLISEDGDIIGVNNFIIQDGNSVGFSLPIKYLIQSIQEFNQLKKDETAVRCISCSNIVSENSIDNNNYCPHCGSKVQLPSKNPEYEALGISQTIESFINLLGHDVKLSRMGPRHWIIKEGSAYIKISYNEREGMIFGDAYLCQLPKTNIAPIYEFLLKQNYQLEGLSFSVPTNSKDIVLSLFIYDRYLNEQTGRELFLNLFKKADELDNILIFKYGAIPREGWKDE